jgi:restriction system protein
MGFWRSILKPSQPVAASNSTPLSLSDQLEGIDWYQFEKLITALVETEGHDVVRRGGAHADGGIDLMVFSEHGETLVQCKHWKAWNVGVRHVRELMGAMMDAGLPSAILITLRGYTMSMEGYLLRSLI